MQTFSRKTELILVLLLTFLLVIYQVIKIQWAAPDFRSIENTQQRKQTFFDYFRPKIEEINQLRQQERALLMSIQSDLENGESINILKKLRLQSWASRYGINDKDYDWLSLAQLLSKHLDQIPASMVLAQAAMESAWGTSRFAREGNNFFGQWCYTEGCGIVPAARSKGASHEVQVFGSTEDALLSYFRNINSHKAYRSVRAIRAQSRAQNRPLSGLRMITGLQKYSQRGQAYIDELRDVIRHNDLEQPAGKVSAQGS